MPHSTRNPAVGRPGGGRPTAAEHGDTEAVAEGCAHRAILGRAVRRRVSPCRRCDSDGALTAAYDAVMLVGRPLLESLATIPFFSGLDPAALERVASGMRSRRFRRGEVIFHAGDPGDALFIIVTGDVKISLPSETGRRGDPRDPRSGRRVRRAGPARWRPAVGHRDRACGDRDRRAAARPVPRADRHRAGVRDALLASLAGELRRLTTHVEELHFLDITGRLAARLVRLAGRPGRRRPPDGSIRLRATLTQAELAAMVGCTRQSVNKLLGQFADDGLIRLDREGIVVMDLAGLVAAARR